MNAMQMDWVGEAPKKTKAQITIPDRRPAIAARKAELAKEIGDLVRRVPPMVMARGVETVRAWKSSVEAAKKVVGMRNATVTELELALKDLRLYEGAQ